MDLKLYLRAQWDRVAAVCLVVAGALALLIGWIGVSGTPFTWEQIPYVVSGGLVGIALIGIGATVWLSADLRDEWRKLKDLEDAVRQHVPAQVELPPASGNGASPSGDEGVAAATVEARPRKARRGAAI